MPTNRNFSNLSFLGSGARAARAKSAPGYTRSVYYYETDQMGIVHHSNYVRWFEEARLAYLATLGLDYGGLEARGLLIPVLGYSCENRHSVRFGETVEVRLWLTGFNGVRMSFAYEVQIAGTDIVAATGTSEHCFTDRELHPKNLKKAYPDVYEAIRTKMDERA